MGWKPRRRWYSCRKRRIKRRLVLGVLVLLYFFLPQMLRVS